MLAAVDTLFATEKDSPIQDPVRNDTSGTLTIKPPYPCQSWRGLAGKIRGGAKISSTEWSTLSVSFNMFRYHTINIGQYK